MAIEIPDDWAIQTWVENTPLAHVETLSSDAVSGRWKVSSWSTVREISSSALPGQVRHKTGLSVGTGKALLKREADDYPWKQRDVHNLTGSDAQILLAPEGGTEIPTGQFKIADVSGDVTTLGVDIDLDERQIAGRDKTPGVLDQQWASGITIEEIGAQVKDPIWLVSELAEQMGFRTGPTVTPGQDGYTPILDVPLQGALLPREPINVPFETIAFISWATANGAVGLSTVLDSSIDVIYETQVSVPQATTVTFDIDNAWAGFEWADSTTIGRFGVQLLVETGDSEVDINVYSTGANGVGNANTNVNNLDVTRDLETPNRMQVEVTFSGTSTLWTSASIRIRRRDGFWFGPYVHPMANGLSRENMHNIEMQVFGNSSVGDGVLSNFSVVDNSAVSATVRDTLLNTVGGEQGRIYLEPLLGTIQSPWLDPDLGVWSTMQAIVEAWQGALITDVYGDLKVLNRNTIAGLNNLQQERVVDVGLRFEDLPWVMNYADQADRLVLKYRPLEAVVAEPTQVGLPIIYEFQDLLVVRPGANEFFFTLDYIYPTDLKLLPFNRKDSDNGVYHVWDAYRYNNGTGAHIAPNTDISMRIDRVSSSTWKVYIVNSTASPFHMVDSSGTPWLKIRSSWYYDQTQEATVERGVGANESNTAVEIDLGHYVQHPDDAEALADFIWARVNRRSWKATTIVTIPDYRLDLGDVIEIQHRRTGMKSNALVTKVELDGKPGSVGQKIDLVLMPSTWEDFDEAWANMEGTGPPIGLGVWNDFDALWDAYTWEDFDRTPTATTVAEIEEAM